jgi:hypothetical protein
MDARAQICTKRGGDLILRDCRGLQSGRSYIGRKGTERGNSTNERGNSSYIEKEATVAT